jgi:hypothetical protein
MLMEKLTSTGSHPTLCGVHTSDLVELTNQFRKLPVLIECMVTEGITKEEKPSKACNVQNENY